MNKKAAKPSVPWLPLAVLCLVPVLAGAQQGSVESMLRGCAAIDDDNQRLACYDQVLIPHKAAEQPAPAQPADESVPEEPAVEAPRAATAEGVAAGQPASDDAFGLKEKQTREAESRSVTIQSIRKSLAGKFIYTTDDGQVWVQVDSRNIRYAEPPFAAEIRTASMGSFLLKPVSGGVSVKVRRER
jgi:hypothetical protein